MPHKIIPTIRQQFPLTEATDEQFVRLAEQLNKKPNDLKREILTAFADVPASCYYIALGEIQGIGQGISLKKRP